MARSIDRTLFHISYYASNMLPPLPLQSNMTPEVNEYLLDLHSNGFEGDTSNDEASIAVASTDNSIWQLTPQLIITPRSLFGVKQVVKLLSEKKYRNISITARGGGTSTAGQSLTNSIVLDCKRYMNRILGFDPETNQVHVECGAVLQQVNNELKQFGVMIGPTVATASRATIGGMIGNDSSGKGSQVYGKMSDCIVSLETVIRGGVLFDHQQELVHAMKTAHDVATPHLGNYWPKLPRFVSGYNLPMAFEGETCKSNRIFCGSEGTLGITTSAILQCVPIPKNQQLLILCFDSFDHALRCGVDLAKHSPTAIETVDELVLETARSDSSWLSISTLLGDVKDEAKAILFVESSNSNKLLNVAKNHTPLLIKNLIHREDQELAWSFRSRSVGLLSSLQGKQRPVPFVEDCAVPPNKLPSFINDFRKLLSSHGLRAGMFGHVDAGVIHVRPALDMQNKHDRDKIRTISEQVVSLVHSYGGILWGEHGKGFRSEFGPQIFGEVIWEQQCSIKHAFDPHNQFNPGKVAVPNKTFPISTIDATTRGEMDASTPNLHVISNVSSCDGNSECQSVSIADSMCPTYRATGDPLQSPRGRAEVLKHWLHRVGKSPNPKKGSFIRRLFNSGNDDDFNNEVKKILDGCLTCKACATSCPMKIDVSSIRAQFYDLYFGRFLRPIRDIAWLHLERSLPIQRYLPSRAIASLIGICDSPKPTYSLAKKIQTTTPEQIVQNKPDVVLLQDTFTTYFREAPFLALLKILKYLDKEVAILPLRPCGKPLHVRGSLEQFNTLARTNIAWLKPISECGIPILSVDPAATLLWRDEYPENDVSVLLPQEFLAKQDLSKITIVGNWRLFPHCIEKNTTMKSTTLWKELFLSMGGDLTIVETSCCGMGGLFGHQKENKQVSQDIWRLHWEEHNPCESDSLVTGYSCHTQANRMNGATLLHPLELIARSISSTH